MPSATNGGASGGSPATNCECVPIMIILIVNVILKVQIKVSKMASSIMNHPVFISEKLAIITCSGEVTSRAIRNYMLKNWNVLSQGLDNSSILIMAGVHGD